MIFQRDPLCVLGTLHLAHKANATLTKMLLQKNNIGDCGAVALAAAVKALFVTMFFWKGLSAMSVLSFWICSSVTPMTPSRSFEVWKKTCLRATKEFMFCCVCGQHFAHAERFLRNWRSMCCIAVVFSEAACLMSADQRYFSAKTDHFHNAFVHTLYLYEWTTSGSTRLKCVHKTGLTKQSEHVCLLEGYFAAMVTFAVRFEHVVSQRGRFGDVVGNMKEPGQGTSSEDLDTSFLHAARQMAG